MATDISIPYHLTDNDLALDSPETKYVLRVKDLPGDERPREKLLLTGPGNLTTPELVAIIWGVGTRREEVLAMARRTIREYGEKTLANEPNPERLAASAGLPLHKACQIIASLELGRRFYAAQAGRPIQVRNASQAYSYLKDMGNHKKEVLRGLYLNSRYQVIHDEVISIGSLTASIVHPREVFQPAVEHCAVAAIIAHNHPSGSLKPTAADLKVTAQLVAAGKVLGIELLDHIIIAHNRHKSIMDIINDADI